MSLLLLFKSGAPVAPPATPTGIIPTATIEIDFTGNPTGTYADIQSNQDGVVSFWRMNSATTFLDERLANNGTVSGAPATTTSPYALDADLGLTFDGSDDYALVPNSFTLSTKGACSIEGWLKLASLPGATADIVTKRGSWLVQINSTGRLLFTCKDDTSTATATSNTVLVTGAWYHVAFVYDDSSIAIYVNGVLDTTAVYSSGLALDGHPLRFCIAPGASAPTYQSSQVYNAGNTTVVITKPTSTAAGDFLLAHIALDSAVGVTAPAGWIPLSLDSGIGGGMSQVYYKIATASEPASYTWFLSGSTYIAAAISRITGVSTLTPICNPMWSATSSGTAHATGSHLGNVPNVMIVALFMSSNGFGGNFTYSSGTEMHDVQRNELEIGACWQTQASPSALSVTGTTVSAAGIAYWLALAGAEGSYASCSLKDWSYSGVARTSSEFARDYAALSSGEGTWTDVSTKVRSWDVNGAARQYELDQMEAGTTSLLLKDEDRSFDPANGSSPYSPNVIPMRRIRGKTTYQSTVYDLFYTYIERWPPQNAIPGYQEIGLTAVDGFDALALADVRGTLEVGYSGTQIDALLDKALWPKDKRELDQGQYVMVGQTLTGAKALASIQEIADSERGIFFIDQAGVATFHDSAHRGSFPRSTQSQVTFVDNNAGTGIVYQGLAPSFDKDEIVNEWTVSPDSSVFAAADQRQEDSDSIAEYWRRSKSRSTRLASNADALAQAGNLLNETAQPGYRFDSITVLPTTTEAYVACLNLRISDRVTVMRGTGPVWDGEVLSIECFIEAKRVSARPGAPWAFTFSLSPVSAGNYRGTIVRDGPVSYWRMGTVS
jgi:concanavalin A-like lectin/glucanase superfamily protein